MHDADPLFPPRLSARAVKAPETPMAVAVMESARGGLGAGDLVWARDTSAARIALVLEPEVDRETAKQMLPLAAVAAADALGQLIPEQIPVEHLWPGRLLVDGGIAGGIEVVIGPDGPDGRPRWMVVAIDVAIRRADRDREPGETAHLTSLHEEGAGDVTRTALVEALGANLLLWLTRWEEDGFRGVHDNWLFRAAGRTDDRLLGVDARVVRGRVLGLDEHAGLVVKPADGGQVLVIPLADVIDVASS